MCVGIQYTFRIPGNFPGFPKAGILSDDAIK